MVEKKKENVDPFKDSNKFQYGALASRLLASNESSQYTVGALDVLAKEGLNLSEESKGFIEGAYASKEGIKTASEIYGNMYQEKFGKTKASDLVKFYGAQLDGLDDTEKAKLSEILKEDKSLGEIQKKILEAQYILDAPEGMFDKEKFREAKKTFTKYQNFMVIQQKLDAYKFEALRSKAVEATRKRELKDITSKL